MIGKRMQRLIAALLAFVLVVSYLPADGFTVSAATVASGTCGENLTWVLDDNGILTISGTGPMTEFSTTVEKPWNSNRAKVKTVVIQEGVTTVGRYAFYYCENLTDIVVPDSIESVKSDAFGGCTKLVQVENGVSYAGNVVLDCDTALTQVTLRDDTVAIASGAFNGCTALTSIEIPQSVACISDSAFSGCSALKTVNFAAGSRLKALGSWAFYNCPLSSFIVPSLLKKIGSNALTRISDLYVYAQNLANYLAIEGSIPRSTLHILDNQGQEVTKLVIPSGVTEIRDSAFSNARLITSVQIPQGVTSIGVSAFSATEALKTIQFPEGVTDIGERAFYDGSLTSVYLPGSIKNIGRYAFYNSTEYIDITYCGTRQQWAEVTREANWAIKRGLYVEDAQIDYYHRYNTTGRCTVCGSGVQGTCGENLIWKLNPDTGTLTISGTGSMNEYTLPSYVPWNYYASAIKKVVVESGVTTISDYAFQGYSNLMNVQLSEGLERIGVSAFQNCSGIENITIPTTLSYVGSSAFSGCNIKKVNITDLAAWCSIDFGYFTANPIMEKRNLYLNGQLVTDLMVPEGTTKIGDYVFHKYYALKSVTIPDSVKSIGEEAFYYCTELKNLDLGNGVTDIGYGAFRYFQGTSVMIPSSVTNIGENAFSGCTNLSSIWLGRGIKSIAYYAFHDCPELKDVYYLGSQTDREKISVGSLNVPLTDATWHYNSCYGSTTHTYQWVVDVENNCGAAGLKHELCSVCDAVGQENVVIPATGDHTYDNSCDTSCNVCETPREITHRYEWVTDVENTCGKDGVKHEACSVCGATRSEGTVIEATGNHNFAWVIDREATCGSAGEKHEKCTVCHKVQSENTVIEATGDHIYEWVVDKENNCGVDGLKHEKCSVCDAVQNENTVIEATGEHTYEWIIDKENNCGVDGFKHEKCSVCDAVQNENTVIEATGDHSYEWIIDKENNCGVDGLKHEKCSVCDAVRNENTVIEATGMHSYDNKCDAICNVCEFERIPSAHVYYNSCDTDCNVCGQVRAIEHSYANNCASICYVCYYVRTPSDHVYSGEFDTICNECGAIRPIAGQFAITYHLDGGENALKNPDVYTFEDTIVLKDATKVGYDFAGWYVDEAKTQAITQIRQMAGELHLYAKYTPLNYEATFDIQGAVCSDYITVTLDDTLGTVKTFRVQNGAKFSPYESWSLPQRSGYVFVGWEYNGKLIKDTIVTKENVELTAVWETTGNTGNAGFNTVLSAGTISNSGLDFYKSGSRVPSHCSCKQYQTTVTLYVYISGERQTVEYLGYSFYNDYYSGYLNRNCYTSGGFNIYNVTTGETLVRANGFDDNYDSWDDGYSNRTDYRGTLEVEPGTLLSISVNGATDDSNKQYDKTPLGGISITAGERRDGVVISYSGEKTMQQVYDTDVRTPGVSKAGYTLAGWYDENNLPMEDTWQYTENKTFHAKWAPIRYQISYELNGGVNSDQNPENYTVEDSVSLFAAYKKGYTFNGWYKDANFTTPVSQISEQTGDIKLYAKFTVNTYKLTVNGNGGVMAPKVTFVSEGSVIYSDYLTGEESLTAYRPAQRKGYIFAGWYQDQTLHSPLMLPATIQEDTTLYAKWIPCETAALNVESIEGFFVNVQGKTEQRYAFVPLSDGEITVTSQSNLDLYGTLYNANMVELISCDDIGDDDLDFSYRYSVNAGKLYYIGVKGSTVSTAGNADVIVNWAGEDCSIMGTSCPEMVYTVSYGSYMVLPEPVRRGYRFLGWFDETGVQVTNGVWDFIQDKILYAKWETVHVVECEDTDGNALKYNTLEEAVEQASAGSILTLTRASAEDLTVSKDFVLDLNGFDLTGNVTVVSGAQFFVKDTKTDDFTIVDEDGYGQITGTVAGVQAAEGYLLVCEETGTSFHKVELRLTDLVLRPTETGVYYQCNFAGDELVAENVARYGVALSVKGVPTEDALGICSWYDVFAPGAQTNSANGTLLRGVMKPTNSETRNASNAEIPVYGRAYILTTDGRYIFGDSTSRSFREQMEMVDSQWNTLTQSQRTAVRDMYRNYQSVMSQWNIPNIKNAYGQ